MLIDHVLDYISCEVSSIGKYTVIMATFCWVRILHKCQILSHLAVISVVYEEKTKRQIKRVPTIMPIFPAVTSTPPPPRATATGNIIYVSGSVECMYVYVCLYVGKTRAIWESKRSTVRRTHILRIRVTVCCVSAKHTKTQHGMVLFFFLHHHIFTRKIPILPAYMGKMGF